MEGLKLRAVVVVSLVAATGLVMSFVTREHAEPKTEQWMLENSPSTLDGYSMRSGPESPLYTYKMDQATYNVLEPYGIVARVYEEKSSGAQYDVVLVASRSKESFHDPRVCFSAQGWALSNQWIDSVETKTRGNVAVTIAIMDGADTKDQIAAYVYKGPEGFYANTQRLKLAMLFEQLRGGDKLDGVFYRVIPLTPRADRVGQINDLKRFIGQYLDAANAASDGFF